MENIGMPLSSTARPTFSHLNWLLPMLVLVVACAWGGVLSRYWQPEFDVSLLLWFRVESDHEMLAGPPGMKTIWLGLSWLGDSVPRVIVGVLTVLVLVSLRRWRGGLFLAALLLSGVTLSTIIKRWVGRPRPQLVSQLDTVTSMSFPSGHAFNSALFYFAVVLMLTMTVRGSASRWSLYVLAASLSIATGIARVALGVHYPTDVIAGWILAGAWLWLWFTVVSRYWPEAFR